MRSGVPPSPVLLWIGIEPRTDADRIKLDRGIATLLREYGSLATKTNTAGVTMLGAGSEEGLEAAIDRLSREFDVEARVTRPQVAYRETLTRSADGEMKYAQQHGGRGHYAHVKIHVHPGARGSGYVFENEVTAGAIPGHYISSIDEAIQESLTRGIIGRNPVDDVRVVLYDGSYHDVDSSEHAFRIAAALAFRAAAVNAGPILLEPIMLVGAFVPAVYEHGVAASLEARRCKMLFPSARWDAQGTTVVVSARVPLSRMDGFGVELHQRTLGKGRFQMVFEHYAPVRMDDDDNDREAGVTSPLPPRRPLRSLRAEEPEPPPDIECDDRSES